jgi:hypothetical protein
MSQTLCKISKVETNSPLPIVNDMVSVLEDLPLRISIGKNNSRQITSDVDSTISAKLGERYDLIRDVAELKVFVKESKAASAGSSKFIGEVDFAFRYFAGSTAYVETEKTNKKTVWFDLVKLVTKVDDRDDRIGVVICPKNYAHKTGIWDLYRDALSYRNHLARLSGNDCFGKIAVIGYTQFAFLARNWIPFDSQVVEKLKMFSPEGRRH